MAHRPVTSDAALFDAEPRPAVTDAGTPRRAETPWMVASAIAAELALVVGPALRGALEPGVSWWLAVLVPAACLIAGLVARSGIALLAGVPVGWALAGYGGAATHTPAEAVVALGASACFLVTALLWLRPPRVTFEADAGWTAHEDGPGRVPQILPVVAAVLVVAPAAGVLLHPEIAQRAAAGFPRMGSLALVGLGVGGTLVALALVADLARVRAPLAPAAGRRWGWVALLAATLGLLAWAAGGLP
jgi:hypothetical protein